MIRAMLKAYHNSTLTLHKKNKEAFSGDGSSRIAEKNIFGG
jgi:hypothetical protein